MITLAEAAKQAGVSVDRLRYLIKYHGWYKNNKPFPLKKVGRAYMVDGEAVVKFVHSHKQQSTSELIHISDWYLLHKPNAPLDYVKLLAEQGELNAAVERRNSWYLPADYTKSIESPSSNYLEVAQAARSSLSAISKCHKDVLNQIDCTAFECVVVCILLEFGYNTPYPKKSAFAPLETMIFRKKIKAKQLKINQELYMPLDEVNQAMSNINMVWQGEVIEIEGKKYAKRIDVNNEFSKIESRRRQLRAKLHHVAISSMEGYRYRYLSSAPVAICKVVKKWTESDYDAVKNNFC